MYLRIIHLIVLGSLIFPEWSYSQSQETISFLVNNEYVFNHIRQKKNPEELNLYIVRALQNRINDKKWGSAMLTLDRFKDSISFYYKDYDLRYFDQLTEILITQDDLYFPRKLNKKVNTRENETNPIIVQDEDERFIYFTRSPVGDESFNEDIYIEINQV